MSSKLLKLLRKLELPEDGNHQKSSQLINYDIVPLPPTRRTWVTLTYMGFWNSGTFTPGTWSNGSSLLSLGLSVGQTMGVLVLGKFLTAVSAVPAGWPGAKFHIGFTIVQREVFGIYGSYFPLLMRIILSVVWYSSGAWMGGLCMTALLSSWSENFLNMKNTFPESVPMTSRELVGFVVYQILNMMVICIKPERIHRFVIIGNLYNAIAMIAIVIWARVHTGSVGDLVSTPTTISGSTLAWTWVGGLTTVYGGIASGVANQSDFTRFAKNKTSPIIGTVLAMWIFKSIVPLVGIITTSCIKNKYGVTIWNPVYLVFFWLKNYTAGSRAAAFFVSFGFVWAQLSVGTIENAFAGGMDLAGLFPRYINILRGSLITALLAWVAQPWTYYNTSSVFVTVMGSFSVFMVPLIGIILCDFHLVRQRKISLLDLYTTRSDGRYYFTYGFNWRAFVAWFTAFTLNLPGMINKINPTIYIAPGMQKYYKGNLFFGMAISVLLYYALCRIWPMKGVAEMDEADYYGTFTEAEALKLGIVPHSQVGSVQLAEVFDAPPEVFKQDKTEHQVQEDNTEPKKKSVFRFVKYIGL